MTVLQRPVPIVLYNSDWLELISTYGVSSAKLLRVWVKYGVGLVVFNQPGTNTDPNNTANDKFFGRGVLLTSNAQGDPIEVDIESRANVYLCAYSNRGNATVDVNMPSRDFGVTIEILG